MLPNGLTLGQESLCQNIVAGMPHGEAYREAYNAGQLKPQAVYSRLFHTLQSPRVKARLEELWREREIVASHTASQLRLFVAERLMIEATKADNPASTRVRAIELVGKLGGVGAFEIPAGEQTAAAADKTQLMARLERMLSTAEQDAVGRKAADY